jgi:hypothetical protein
MRDANGFAQKVLTLSEPEAVATGPKTQGSSDQSLFDA